MAHLRASATGEELVEAVQATPEDTASDLAELAADEAQTLQAIAILQAGGKGAYKQALVLVREDTAQWCQQVLERDGAEEAYSPDAAGLLRFLQEEVGRLAARPRWRTAAGGCTGAPRPARRGGIATLSSTGVTRRARSSSAENSLR